jgi:RNA polymerase subunit RPABC4/transcription elongation factor Spt4
MSAKFSVVGFLFLVFALIPSAVDGQTNCEPVSRNNLLSPVWDFANYELILRYIDDAVVKADSDKSNLIVIVEMKNAENYALARTRIKNLKNYFRFRKYENFEVVIDLETEEADRIELHVRGKRLYALPIRKKDRLEIGR